MRGSNGSQQGLPHAFSDPQLQEHGATSAFGSEEWLNFPSTSSFVPPPLLSCRGSLSNKMITIINFIHKSHFEMRNMNPFVDYSGIDFMQGSIIGSDSLMHQDRKDDYKNTGLQTDHDNNWPYFSSCWEYIDCPQLLQ